jgi:hypothetical protein
VLAEQLLASAQDLSAKLVVERNVSIAREDIARYMIGLDGTDHVVYGHLVAGADDRAAEIVGAAFGGKCCCVLSTFPKS